MGEPRNAPPKGRTDSGGQPNESGTENYSVKAWMPIWIGDYLADTRRLTTEQHGAYLLLLFDYWRSGPLPDDDAALAQITGLSKERWKSHKPAIARFFRATDGEWRHKRVDAEIDKAAEHKRMTHERAKVAARARWKGGSGDA